jgi:hypothetical protein
MKIEFITMKDLLQDNKTINHPITTPIYGDKQQKYKITSKDLSLDQLKPPMDPLVLLG